MLLLNCTPTSDRYTGISHLTAAVGAWHGVSGADLTREDQRQNHSLADRQAPQRLPRQYRRHWRPYSVFSWLAEPLSHPGEDAGLCCRLCCRRPACRKPLPGQRSLPAASGEVPAAGPKEASSSSNSESATLCGQSVILCRAAALSDALQ